MKRISLAGVAGAVVAALVMSACGSSAPQDSGSPSAGGTQTSQSSSSTKPVKLTFETLAWRPDQLSDTQAVVDAWNAANPNIQVEVIRGDWSNIEDQLTTGFEGGKAPDIFHFESGTIQEFATKGWLLDLNGKISKDVHDDIGEAAWETVKDPGTGSTFAAPFLQETQVVFVNTDDFKKAGIDIPTFDNRWTWDDFAKIAKELTIPGKRSGAGLPLGYNPVGRMVEWGASYDAKFFEPGNPAKVVFGDNEKNLAARIHKMLYDDKSASLDAVNLGTIDAVPGFLKDDYSMLVGTLHLRDDIVEGAGDNFHWVAVPLPAGSTTKQGTEAQTFSISAQTKHPDEAVKFLDYMLSPENQLKVAKGFWLIPTSKKALADPSLDTTENSWDVAIESAKDLEYLPFQAVQGYGFEEWANKVGNPTFEDYFANKISLDDAANTMVTEGDKIFARYTK